MNSKYNYEKKSNATLYSEWNPADEKNKTLSEKKSKTYELNRDMYKIKSAKSYDSEPDEDDFTYKIYKEKKDCIPIVTKFDNYKNSENIESKKLSIDYSCLIHVKNFKALKNFKKEISDFFYEGKDTIVSIELGKNDNCYQVLFKSKFDAENACKYDKLDVNGQTIRIKLAKNLLEKENESNNNSELNKLIENKNILEKESYENSKNKSKLNKNVLRDYFGYEFNENDRAFNVLTECKYKNLDLKIKWSEFYFQNRKDVYDIIYNQIKRNVLDRESLQSLKSMKLINLTQNNGTGKTTVLIMLQYYIKEIEIADNNFKIYYPEVINFIDSEKPIILTCIYIFLQGINETIFKGMNLEIKEITTTNIEMKLFSLSKNLNTYLSNNNSKLKKESWNKLTDFFYKTNGNINDIIEYKEPKKQLIIFRIDEIGNISSNPDIHHKSEYIENLLNFFKLMKFENPHKIMRLYCLRKIINDFCNSRIEVIVAGKNSFMPFMGYCLFRDSPCELLHINLNPLCHNNEFRYIENIVLYRLMTTNNNNSLLKNNLLKIAQKIEKDDDEKIQKFNKMMDLFYGYISKYSGGHPRMIGFLITFLEENFDCNEYLKNFNLPEEDVKMNLKTLFKDLSSNFLNKIKNIILRTYRTSDLLSTLLNILKEKDIDISEDNILYFIYRNRKNSNLIFSFCNYFIEIIENLQQKLQFKSTTLKIKLSLIDIINSLGILFIDNENTMKEDNTDNYDYSNVKFFFPKLLKYHLKSKYPNFDELEKMMILSAEIKNISFTGENYQKFTIEYLTHIFMQKDPIKNKLPNLFKSIVNFSQYLNYYSVEIINITGNKDSKLYIENISKQIKQIIPRLENNNVLFIVPTLQNNYIHDFFVLIPNNE